MTWLQTVLSHPLFEQLGWTLAHSVWQCAVVTAVLAIMFAIVRRSSARYWTSCAALVACVIMPIATFVVFTPPPVTSFTAGHFVPANVIVDKQSTAVPTAAETAPWSWHDALPWAAVAWLLGVVGLSVRHIGAWVAVHAMRRRAVAVTDRALQDCLRRLSRQMRIAQVVKLAQSALVNVPAVAGFWQPMILLPCSALTGLPPNHLQALLAHELAHIRRHDYLANLLQTAIETLLFYHPAVWWISRQIRQECEHCCDDLAVAVVGDPHIYSEALAAMEQVRSMPANLALAASGGSLLRRIQRLLSPQPPRGTAVWPVLLMLAVIIGVAACKQMKATGQATQPAEQAPSLTPSEFAEVVTDVLHQELAALQAEMDRVEAELANVGGNDTAKKLELEQRLDAFRALVAQKAKRLGEAQRRATATQSDEQVQRIGKVIQDLNRAQFDLLEKESMYGKQHPTLQRAQQEEQRAWDSYQKAMEYFRGSQEPDVTSLQQQIDALKLQLRSYPPQSKDNQIFKRLTEQLEAAKAQLAAKMPGAVQGPPPDAYFISGVQHSGTYDLGERKTVTLPQAIAAAGGLEAGAEKKHVLIVHQTPVDGRMAVQVPAADAADEKKGQIEIRAGDVIMLNAEVVMAPAPQGQYCIAGDAARPGLYPWQKNMTLLQALVTGGLNPPDVASATVELRHADGESKSYRIGDLIAGSYRNVPVNDGDVITVRGATTSMLPGIGTTTAGTITIQPEPFTKPKPREEQ